MIHQPEIRISDYTYDLPEDRIATYPATKRDASKLLIYNKGIISDTGFSRLPENFAEGSLMVFNNTKVVPARLLFRRATGAFIEIFCLEPVFPEDYNINFASTDTCKWKCIVGNRKKWKDGEIISLYIPEGHESELAPVNLRATLEDTIDNSFIIKFQWDTEIAFSSVMEICGRIPIPPYLNRESEAIDSERYQTMYAKLRGSVAAPTAGLHFTEDVFKGLDDKGVQREYVCLHVGAGTFLPVKSETIAGHVMHSEPFSISKEALAKIYNKLGNNDIIAVGTTSVRTLESLYWLGRQCVLSPDKASWEPQPIGQWDPYNADVDVPAKEAIGALLEHLDLKGENRLFTKTQIIIVPSYRFRIINKLVTNFHQPQSTLLLLIAALIGEDWRKVYDYALDNSFRFLSYGDSSLLIPR